MRKVTLSPAVHGPVGDPLQIMQIDFPDITGKVNGRVVGAIGAQAPQGI